MIPVVNIVVQVTGKGPPELVTGGGDGAVRVWDVRQPDAPVAAFPPDATGTEKVRLWRGTCLPISPARQSARDQLPSYDHPAVAHAL